MGVKSGQVWTGVFPCRDATGALATPSVGPVGSLYVAGAANGASVTIGGSNPYTFSVTLPVLTAGQTVSLYVTATIAGIATASVIAEEVADTYIASDVYSRLTGTVEPLVAAQAIRDTLKLAPTAGTAAEGSIDDQLADIEAQTDDIGAAGAGLTALGDTRLANLDVTVSSRSVYAGADTVGTTTLLSRLSATRAGYLDNLSAGAVALEATLSTLVASIWTGITGTAANLIADHVLRRTTANVEASANGDLLSARSLYGAVARLVHKVSVSGSTMTSYRADDSTSLTTAALTTDSSAAPTIGIDPAA